MALTLRIAGIPKVLTDRSLHVAQTANGRATASFTIDSTDGSYRPALDAEVIIEENAVRIFGGLVARPSEEGLLDGAHPGIRTKVSADDFHTYADRRYVNLTLASGTLKAKLQTLHTTYLAAYGVTLDALQVDGPTLPDLTYEYRQLTDVLNELMTLTADFGQPYVWRINEFKVLRAYQPSTQAAPFNITGPTVPQVIGDLVVESSREHYANRVVVKMPTRSEMGRVETFTGNGTTSTFTLNYRLFGHRGYVTSNGVFETFTTDPAGGATWVYDATLNTITRNSPPGNGHIVSINFDGQRAGEGLAQDASEIALYGIYEQIITVENLPSDTTAQQLADSHLARSLPITRTVTYHTRETGIAPGQSQTITVTARNLSVTAMIAEVVIRDHGRDGILRTVKAVVDASQTNLGRGWRDTYRAWLGDKTGSSTAIAVAVGAGKPPAEGGTAAPPFTSVQFNNSGAFGGDAAFVFKKTTKSLVCGGGGSSVDAGSFSCQVFGHNCHISA